MAGVSFAGSAAAISQPTKAALTLSLIHIYAVAYLRSAIRLMWFKIYRPPEFYAVYFTVRGDDIDYEAAVGGAAVARAHMEEVKRRLKEEKNAKDCLLYTSRCV